MAKYRWSFFPDDTERIALDYGSMFRNEISVQFDRKRSYSKLRISLIGDSARQNVEGVAAEILAVLENYKTPNRIFHPPDWVEFALWLIGCLLLGTFFALAAGYIKSGTPIEAVVASACAFLLVVFYGVFRRWKPYSVFETRQNKRREKWSSWLVFTTLEFLLFTAIGGLVLKVLLGL